MTLRDIAEVTWTITRLDITAQSENAEYLHHWIIGERFPHIRSGSRMFWDMMAGKISIAEKKVNVHGNRKGQWTARMGWGLDESSLPVELMDAKIRTLSMRCRDGVTFEVTVDIELPAILVDMLKQELDPFTRREEESS